MKKILFLITSLLCAAQKQGYSLTGKCKYPDGFKHYDFVNVDAPQGGELTLGEMGDFDCINPEVSNTMRSGRVHPLAAGSLMMRALDEPMTVYCYCADSIEVAEDRKSVVFTINPKAQWDHHYGELTADDVVFSFNTWRQHGSIYFRALYKMIQKVEKVDHKTVRFYFDSTSPTLPIVVGCMPLLCEKFYAEKGIDALYSEPAVSLNAYRITHYKKGESILYERKRGFWGEDLPCMRGFNNYDKVVVRYYRDLESLRLALFKGDVDSVLERNPVYYARGQEMAPNDHIRYYEWEHGRPAMEHLMVINTRKAYLKDRRVRQALCLLFRHDILDRYFYQGFYQRLSSIFHSTDCHAKEVASEEEMRVLRPFSDTLPEGFEQPFKHVFLEKENYPKRVKMAVDLLEKAGWVMDAEKKALVSKETGKVFPALHIYCNGEAEKAIAQDFEKRLRKVGIKLVVHLAEVPYLSHVMGSHALYDFGFMRYLGTYYPSLGLYGVFHSSLAHKKGSRNYAGICHPAVDWLLEEIQKSDNIQEQVTYARALDRVVMHEYFFIPLFFAYRIAFWCWDRIEFPPLKSQAGYLALNSYLRDPVCAN